LVPYGDSEADLSKGFTNCCDWYPENEALQVNTYIDVSQFDSVECSPSDGRMYGDEVVDYSDPAYYVICLVTNEGRYYKYYGGLDCCECVAIVYVRTY
jgi:hypothetical protein